ncbi:MAG: type IV toxin-antitoxin system AbiEi family antitoxin domain-containing protein [Erysipelothrix sp.]|nr:type IV toxin-antitoxin system AbiEi family antitoxin domain-containing protein [Erysipelothrix sp.]
MTKKEKLKWLLKENNGYIKTSDATKNNISKTYFNEFVKENNLENVAHGIYIEESNWEDDYYIVNIRYPDSIFSHKVAGYLHGLSDREPLQISLTLPTGKSSSRLNHEGVKVYKVKNELFEVGLIDIETNMGNKVRCYDKERTICDYLRSRSNIESQELQSVIKSYFRSQDKNLPRLMRYAELFSVSKLVEQYSRVLL